MSANSSPKRASATSIEQVLEEVNNQDHEDTDSPGSKSDLYVVEKILGRKKYKGVIKYKVKWEGYPESQSTWEPIEHLENVKNLIEEFEKSKKSGKRETSEEGKKRSKSPMEKKPKPPAVQKPRPGAKKVKKEPQEEIIKLEKKIPSQESDKENENEHEHENENQKKIEKEKENVPKESSQDENFPVYGHFKYGDKPKRIIRAKPDNGSVLFTIEWNQRKNGETPMNTQVPGVEVRKYDKDLLLDFYETRIKFVRSESRGNQKEPLFMIQNRMECENYRGEEKTRDETKDSSVRTPSKANNDGFLEVKKEKLNESIGKRSEATTRNEEDAGLSEFGTPGHFRVTIDREIANTENFS